MHTCPLSVTLDTLLPLDSLSPCLFLSCPGCIQNTFLFFDQSPVLRLTQCLQMQLRFYSFLFIFTLSVHAFPTPPTLASTSLLSCFLATLLPLPLYVLRLSFLFHLVQRHSLHPQWIFLLPLSVILLLTHLIFSALLPWGIGSLWLVLSGVWISVLSLAMQRCVHAVRSVWVCLWAGVWERRSVPLLCVCLCACGGGCLSGHLLVSMARGSFLYTTLPQLCLLIWKQCLTCCPFFFFFLHSIFFLPSQCINLGSSSPFN